jgi:hypothetical protein
MRKWPWPDLKYYPGIWLKALRKPQKKAGYPFFGARFEPRDSKIRNWGGNHWTVSFGR